MKRRRGGRGGSLASRCARIPRAYACLLLFTVPIVVPLVAWRHFHVDRRGNASVLQASPLDSSKGEASSAFTAGGTRSTVKETDTQPVLEDAYRLEPLQPPHGAWPNDLVLSIAVGMPYEALAVVLQSFEKNVMSAVLVLFSPSVPRGWVDKERVVLQLYKAPQTGKLARLGYWVERFLVYELFLKRINHTGRVILSDSRDVAFLGNPFQVLPDKAIHFFQESTVLPKHLSEVESEPKSDNWQWLANCFDERNAWLYGGSHVVSAGFLLGTTAQILAVLNDMRVEFGRVPAKCLEAFGGDQATIIHIIKSGRVRLSIPADDIKLESNERGPVLTIFQQKKAPYMVIGDQVVTTMGEAPFAVIHGYPHWPDLNALVRRNFPALK
eukprot:TRINITY_DN33083_c0_g1_i1.p1 TRINITY_DN33083_c0_g1~~TRINITY_DN33083_c0_g1_i1.p1  ORF type:complete len:383 (-),score=47.22 TRINITY_DN33083_c0_g1_i1:543-1691(-)